MLLSLIPSKLVLILSMLEQPLIKKLADINQCLTDPANLCLTNINQYYIS